MGISPTNPKSNKVNLDASNLDLSTSLDTSTKFVPMDYKLGNPAPFKQNNSNLVTIKIDTSKSNKNNTINIDATDPYLIEQNRVGVDKEKTASLKKSRDENAKNYKLSIQEVETPDAGASFSLDPETRAYIEEIEQLNVE